MRNKPLPGDPDGLALFGVLSRPVASTPDEVCNAVQQIREMVAANVISRFEAKLDAMRSELTILGWLLDFGFATLIATAIAHLFRSAGEAVMGEIVKFSTAV